jgi:L-asparagine oxygenase
MDSRDIAEYVLSASESASMTATVDACWTRSALGAHGYKEFAHASQMVAEHLKAPLEGWVERTRQSRVGLLRNLPIGNRVAPTPTKERAAYQPELRPNAVIGSVAALFGVPYTYEGKRDQKLVHDVFPVRAMAQTQLGVGSVALEWHVEDGFHGGRPDWMVLLCVRGDPDVKTYLAKVRDMALSEPLSEYLREHSFQLRVDDSFAEPFAGQVVPVPVLKGPKHDPEIVLDPAYTLVADTHEQAALNQVCEQAEQVSQAVVLERGDALFFDNRRVVHARSAYDPRYDGGDRWVKRLAVISDPGLIQQLDDGRLPFHMAR